MTLRFRLLPCAVEVTADDGALGERLRYLSNAAEQEGPVLRTLRYDVAGHGPYAIREEGDALAEVERADDVLAIVYRRCHQRALDLLALGGWSLLHGAIASVHGRRVLVLGAKGTGKSTLMLRLLHDGHAVEGDELALVRDGLAVAFPRRLRLKPGVTRLVPEVAALLDHLPYTMQDGARVAALDPREAGFGWRLPVAPLAATFLAQPAHGEASRTRALAPREAVPRMLAQAIRLDRSPEAGARLVRECAVLAAGETHELQLGDLAGAVRALAAPTAVAAPSPTPSPRRRGIISHLLHGAHT